MQRQAIVYFSTLLIMLPLDLLFLGTIGKKIFESSVGDMILSSPRMAPAVLFYLLYGVGVVIFVNGAAPGNWQSNLLYGALFGLFCYATFELTSMALLRHWEWNVVAVDIGWGTAMTAVSAALGGLLAQWLAAKFG
jgi:uncharacterized membrane protein